MWCIVCNGVKHGCVLVLTLFGTMLLKHTFGTSTDGIYMGTRLDGRLFNLVCLLVRTKVDKVIFRDMLFVNDATLHTHTQHELRTLMHQFSLTCNDLRLTISLTNTNILRQGTTIPNDDHPSVHINQFHYNCQALRPV